MKHGKPSAYRANNRSSRGRSARVRKVVVTKVSGGRLLEIVNSPISAHTGLGMNGRIGRQAGRQAGRQVTFNGPVLNFRNHKTHTHTHTHRHAHTHTNTHTHMNTRKSAGTHTCTDTIARTHTHTHTRI